MEGSSISLSKLRKVKGVAKVEVGGNYASKFKIKNPTIITLFKMLPISEQLGEGKGGGRVRRRGLRINVLFR